MFTTRRPLLIGVAVLGAACNPNLPEEADIELDMVFERSDAIPTVVNASWELDLYSVEEAWIEYGLNGETTLQAPVNPSDDAQQSALLLGMKPNSEYQVRVGMRLEDGQTQYSDMHTISTGMAAPGLPHLDVTRSAAMEDASGFIVTSTLVAPAAALVIDMDGDIVWWHMPQENSIGRVQLSRDGTGIFYQRVNSEADANHVLRYVSFDGQTKRAWDVPAGHHDFTELRDGTIALLVHDPLRVGGELVFGDKIVELSPDGTLTDIYSTWDNIEYEPSNTSTQGTGWTHANVIQYDEKDDAYLVSFKSLDGIHKIDRKTGQRIWALGGDLSDFTLQDGSRNIFESQHQFQMLEDSILVFVNGDEVTDLDSIVVEYSFDESNPVVEELWSYENDPGLFCFSLGDVQRLANGNTHINWSVQGQIDEVSPSGEVLWRLTGGLGSAFGYSERMQSLYVE